MQLAIAVGLQHVGLVDVLIVKMMARLVTSNVVVVDHLLHPAAIVAGQRRVDLEAAPTAKMMVRLVTVNAVGVGPLPHRLAHLAHQARLPLVPNGVRQLGISRWHMVLLNCKTVVGQSMVTVAQQPRPPTTWLVVLWSLTSTSRA